VSGRRPLAPADEGAEGGASPRRKRLTFVTGNKGKATELGALLAPHGFEVMQDPRGYPEIQADTLAEVTEAGADHLLANGLQPPFVLEDSGLFIDSLKGFPGAYSRHALDTIGCDGILRLMAEVPLAQRSARFEADLLLVEGRRRRHFAGLCPGRIATEAAGAGGFGFDPIFAPAGRSHTFAEMPPAGKSRLSHRGQAARALLEWLSETAKP